MRKKEERQKARGRKRGLSMDTKTKTSDLLFSFRLPPLLSEIIQFAVISRVESPIN